MTAADQWFSRCVRERAGWICEYCRTSFPRNAMNLHCSHYHSRRHKATRYDPQNAFAHCAECHGLLADERDRFDRWVEDRLGAKQVSALLLKANTTCKLSRIDEARISDHYRTQLERLQNLRDQGHTGYLHFAEW